MQCPVCKNIVDETKNICPECGHIFNMEFSNPPVKKKNDIRKLLFIFLIFILPFALAAFFCSSSLLVSSFFYFTGDEYKLTRIKSDVRNNPANPEARISLGKIYLKKKNYTAAIEEFEKAVKLDPDNYEANKNLGIALYKANFFDKSFKVLNRALEINPRSYDALIYLGNIVAYQYDYTKAITYFSRASNVNPTFAEPYMLMGAAYKQLKNVKVSEKNLLKAIELEPKQVKAYQHLYKLYYTTGKYDKAIQCAKESFDLSKSAYDIYYIAYIYEAKKDYKSALYYYKESIDKEKIKATDAYNRIGICYMNLNNYNKAESYFKNILSKDAYNENTYYALFELYTRKNEILKARKIEKELNIIVKDKVKLAKYLGNICLRIGKYEQAEKYFASALINAPEDFEIYNDIGSTYYKRNQIDKSMSFYMKAKSLNPDSGIVNYNIAWVYLRKGNLKDAYKYSSRLKTLDAYWSNKYEQEYKGFIRSTKLSTVN